MGIQQSRARKQAVVLCLALAGTAHAQFGRGAGDWATSGADAQRSSWVRSDPKISKGRVQKGEFQFLWKMKLDSQPREVTILDRYIGYRGFRALAFVGTGSDHVYGIDADLARMEWEKRFSSAPQPASASCGGGLFANVTRQVNAAFPALPEGRGGGFGRGGAARSGVGEPGQGAVTLAALAAAAATPPPGLRGPAPRPGPSGFRREPIVMYSLSNDGMLHTMYVSNGEEPEPPVRFLPANANAVGFVVLGNIAYAATSGGCGGVPDGVWALDLTSKAVTHWEGAVRGPAGPAFGPDSTVYVTSAKELVALDPKTLKVKNSYKSSGPEFASSPVIFQYRERTLLAVSSKDGRIHLLAPGASNAQAFPPVQGQAGMPAPQLASWQDSTGTRWLLQPAENGVIAWKVVEQEGGFRLQQGWVSKIASPLTPMIMNDVVFVASGQVLYALDGVTGKELWDSGKTMTSSAGSLSGGSSQLYLGTNDGTLYAFGFPLEH